MSIPDIALDDIARERLAAGAGHLARCIRPALGPRGGSVLVDRTYADPRASRDGAYISRRVECSDPVANLGLKVVREAARIASEEAGDGTTTAMVLAGSILSQGWRAIASGVNPRDLRKGIDAAWREADASLAAQARPLNGGDLDLARRSAGDEYLGDLVLQGVDATGPAGLVLVESDPGQDAWMEMRMGMTFPSRLLSEAFLTDGDRHIAELDDAYVLVHEAPLISLEPLVPLLEKVLDTGRPLVVIAEEIEGEALASLALNAGKGVLKGLAIRAPGFGKRRRGFFEDVACLTGAEFFAREKGMCLETAGLEVLGRTSRLEATGEKVLMTGGGGKTREIEKRLRSLDREIADETSPFDKEKLQERRARLAGGIAILHVGGHTEAEGIERRARVRNAVSTLASARRDGVVQGGGVALLHARPGVACSLSDEQLAGRRCLARAMAEPLRALASNAGFDGPWIAERLKAAPDCGWDALTGSITPKAGPKDPVAVTRTALRAAVGAAGALLEAGAAVAHQPHREETVFL